MEWAEIYARLMRDREDVASWEAMEQRVRAWARPDLWTRGWHLVEDAVADTCASAVLALEGARGPETFAGYVRGHYLNIRRRLLRETSRPEFPLPPALDLPRPAPDEPPSDLELRALEQCLETLTGRELLAVRMRYYDDRPSADIAAALRVNVGNARKILFKGLTRLRRCAHAALAAPGPLANAG
jgi:RNA polymerase sigma factor (sigma-70 family)